jgi:hypothetical protein
LPLSIFSLLNANSKARKRISNIIIIIEAEIEITFTLSCPTFKVKGMMNNAMNEPAA